MSDSLPFLDLSSALENLPLVDADIRFCTHFFAPSSAEQLMLSLFNDTVWRQEKIQVWGKLYAQPRLVAWHGDPTATYAYSGLILTPAPWTPVLLEIKTAIETVSGHRFNSVLLNLYRNEQDHMGWHSDDESELGECPLIASLSLGATRTFKLKHKTRPEQKTLNFDLNSGSLLLMAGDTQRHWKHCIAKETRNKGARINLTFRQIISR
jgi:alkylated DNA repair dioxygenase AlkB